MVDYLLKGDVMAKIVNSLQNQHMSSYTMLQHCSELPSMFQVLEASHISPRKNQPIHPIRKRRRVMVLRAMITTLILSLSLMSSWSDGTRQGFTGSAPFRPLTPCSGRSDREIPPQAPGLPQQPPAPLRVDYFPLTEVIVNVYAVF